MFHKQASENSPLLKEYNQLRNVSKRLSEEIPEIYGLDKSLTQIIRIMGIGRSGTIVLESEEEVNFMIDFYLHEYQENGQTMLDRYRTDHPEIDQLVTAYIDAAQASYTSLFKIISTHPSESSLQVADLLNPSEPLTVININLSKTAKPGHILFSRLLPYENFNAFSGMYAVFPSGGDRALLKRYKVMKKRIKSDRESVQRFVACFKLNRVLGKEFLSIGV